MSVNEVLNQLHQLANSNSASIDEYPRVNAQNTTTQCSICLENFREEQEMIQLPCEHVFHENCIRRWLERNNNCPYCRRTLFERSNVNISVGFMNTVKLTFIIQGDSIQTIWKPYDKLLDIFKFLSHLNNVSLQIQISTNEERPRVFKSTESYYVLNRSLVEHNIVDELTLHVDNIPNSIVIGI